MKKVSSVKKSSAKPKSALYGPKVVGKSLPKNNLKNKSYRASKGKSKAK